MNILQVVKYYYPHNGGIESYTREIVLGLKDRPEIKFEILTANFKAKTVQEMVDGVLVNRIASYGELFSVPLCPVFPWVLRSKRADIIHFQMPFPLAEFSEILLPKRAKIIATWHSDIVKQVLQRKLYEPFLLRFLDRVDKILVATPNHITSSQYLPMYKNKCEVVPFGIDIDRFEQIKPDNPNVLFLKQKYGPGLVLFVGRLVYYKGVEYLIRAMRNVSGHLIIIGDGPLKQKLLALVKLEGLENKVTLLDSVQHDQLPFYYQACDVFVLPSIANSEAFGIVQLEAMACGKPVVTTDLPTGVTYVNQHNVTGLVVPRRDSAALSLAINDLLAHPAKRQQLGDNGYQRAREIYNKTVMVESIYKIYSQMSLK